MSIDLAQIESLGVTPIPGDLPGGTNVQDSDEYDKMDRSFMALTSIEGAPSGDVRPRGEDVPTWLDVAEKAITILRDKSKNMRVSVILTIALFHQEGLPGLCAGLKMIDGMMANFWDTMWPPLKLIKGRASALEFMATNLAGDPTAPGGILAVRGQQILKEFRAAMDQNPSQSEYDARYEELKSVFERIEGANKSLAALKEKVYEKFPQDKIPVMSSLNDTMKDLALNISDDVKRFKKAEAPPPSAAGPSQPTPTAAQPVVRQAPAASQSMAVSAGNPIEARKAMLKLAPVLREADPTDPASYRLSRWGCWGSISNPPGIKSGSMTMVPPGNVNKQMIESAQGMMGAGNWMVLLNQSEPRFPNCPLWLDQQHHIYKSLMGMGAAFHAAARAVADELANFIRRVPSIYTLTFDGGIPFADPSTVAWIESEVITGAAGGGGGGGAAPRSVAMPSGDGAAGLEEALGKAKQLVGDGKLADALKLLEAGPAEKRASQRDRFLWRAAMARVLQESGKAKLTQPIWDALLDEIDRYQLETWEPELCVQVFHALYQICRADKAQAERADRIFGRLCRASIEAALHLEK